MSRSRCATWVPAAVAGILGCRATDAIGGWPARLVVQSGNFQSGLRGFALNDPPVVKLVDVDGRPIDGASITFTVTAGGGSVTAAVATTDAGGLAAAGSWRVNIGSNQLTASIPAPFRVPPVTFSATGLAPAFHIDVTFLTATPPARQAVFTTAAARWEQLVYGDLVDIPVNIPAGQCLGNEPAIVQTIDDVLIFVTLDSIDGPGQILGGSAPCFIRSVGKLPLIGIMIFDTADVAQLEQLGLFDEVIEHEMGHVIGFGTIWDPAYLNLIAGPSLLGGTDPHFTGARAIAAFNRAGGTGYTAGAKVPVENTGGPGTADSHWRESVFHNELMTGFLNIGANPLSVVTVASLEDEGYRANYAAADAYSVTAAATPPGAPGAAGPIIALGNDVLRIPIWMMDRQGRVTGVYRR